MVVAAVVVTAAVLFVFVGVGVGISVCAGFCVVVVVVAATAEVRNPRSHLLTEIVWIMIGAPAITCHFIVGDIIWFYVCLSSLKSEL